MTSSYRNTLFLPGAIALSLFANAAGAATELSIAGQSNTPIPVDDSATRLIAYNLGFGNNVNGNGPSGLSSENGFADTESAGVETLQQGIPFRDLSTTNNFPSPPVSPAELDLNALVDDGANPVKVKTTTSTGLYFGSFGPFGGGDNLYGTFIYATGQNTNDQAIEITGLDNTKSYRVQILVGDNRDLSFDADVFINGQDSGQNLVWGGASNGFYNLATVIVSGEQSLDFALENERPGISGVLVHELPSPPPGPAPAAPIPAVSTVGLLALLGGLLGAGGFFARRRR